MMADQIEGHAAVTAVLPPAGPPSGKSTQTLASPRKQGRFLIIEPPKMEDDEDSFDSRSGHSLASSSSPRSPPSADIQSRFAMATSSNYGELKGVLDDRGGLKASGTYSAPSSTEAIERQRLQMHTEHGHGASASASSAKSNSSSGAPGSAPLSSSSLSSSSSSIQNPAQLHYHQHQHQHHQHQKQAQQKQSSSNNPFIPSPSAQPSSTAPGFTVKNTVGPLFDPAMASAMGWDDDSSGADADSSSAEQQMSISVSAHLLPPMSPYGSGQVPQRERERIRNEWLDNIMVHKAEQDRIVQERLQRQQRELAAKEAAAAAARSVTQTPSTATTASSIPSHEEGTPRSLAADSSASVLARKASDAGDNLSSSSQQHPQSTILDLPTYQATKRASGEAAAIRSQGNASPPLVPNSARRTDHRRSASDVSLEARMQARRDSGPPPPRPTDDHDVTRSVSTTSVRSPRNLAGGVRINDAPTTIDLTSSHGEISSARPSLSESASDINLSASAEIVRGGSSSPAPKRSKQQENTAAADGAKTRGRSASVSKKIGGLFGRIFESKPKVEKASKSQHRSEGSSKKSKHRGTSVSSGGVSPGGTQHNIVHYSGEARVSVEDSAESSSTSHAAATSPSPPASTDSIDAFTSSASADSLAVPTIIHHQGAPVFSASAPHINTPPASPVASSSSSIAVASTSSSSAPVLTVSSDANPSPPSRPSRPKPPVPPKPNSLLRHAQTLRPSTSTAKEFGLDDTQ